MKSLDQNTQTGIASIPVQIASNLPKVFENRADGPITISTSKPKSVRHLRDYFERTWLKRADKTGKEEEKRKIRKIIAYTGFSKDVIGTKYIPAMQVGKDGEITDTKVSMIDIMAAFETSLLHPDTYYQPGWPKNLPGIYVNYSNAVVKVLVELMKDDLASQRSVREEFRKIWEIRFTMPRLRLPKFTFTGHGFNVKSTMPVFRKPRVSLPKMPSFHGKRVPVTFPNISKQDVAWIVQKHPDAQPYLDLITLSEYLDGLISEANGITPSRIAIERSKKAHKAKGVNGYGGISFNLNAGEIEDILEGNFGSKSLDVLLELLLHEKVHNITHTHDLFSIHGRTFYRRKEELRNRLIRHCIEKNIDPEKKLSEILSRSGKSSYHPDVRHFTEWVYAEI